MTPCRVMQEVLRMQYDLSRRQRWELLEMGVSEISMYEQSK